MKTMNDPKDQKVIESVWWTLRISFGLLPLLAGLDKFFNVLVYWPKYIAPSFAPLLPLSAPHFMQLVGVIEIIAGLGLLFTAWSKVFAYLVAAWLTCIAINLIAGKVFDVAVRDLAMAVTAVSLARLTDVVHVASGARHRLRAAPATT
jgi:uncharacterized membrane protein YphA (DoxX/SURF4 family)